MSADPTPDTPRDLAPVALLGIPVALHAQAAAHGDALQRELEMLRRSDDAAEGVPHRLHQLIERMHERFGGLADTIDDGLAAATASGREQVDLEVLAPVEAGEACRVLSELLDELDEYCRKGDHLLTLATPPEAIAYRRWFLGQFTTQLAGAAPERWGEPGAVGDDEDEEVRGFTVDRGGERPRVVAPDDVDLSTAPELRSILNDLRAEGHRRLTVDLSETAFLDSVGVSVLVAAHARLDDDGGELRIVIGPRARRLFELTGLDEVLHLVDDGS